MADVRAQSGVPVAANFSGFLSPTPSTPIVIDLATGGAYFLGTGDVVTSIGSYISGNSQITGNLNVVGKIAIGSNNTANGMLQVNQTSDTSSFGIAVRNSGVTRTVRLWVDATDVSHLDSGISGTGSLILNAGAGPVSVPGTLTVATAAGIIASASSSPASGAAGTAGAITWDSGFIYVCTASGAWKRAALTGGY